MEAGAYNVNLLARIVSHVMLQGSSKPSKGAYLMLPVCALYSDVGMAEKPVITEFA